MKNYSNYKVTMMQKCCHASLDYSVHLTKTAFVISRGLVSAHDMCCMHISNSIIDADYYMHALK